MARQRRDPGRAATATAVPLPAAGTLVSIEVDRIAAPSTSRVETVDGWQVTVVAPTRGSGQPVVVEPGTPVSIGWGDEAGWWQASATLTGHGWDVVALWELTTERVERWQRRDAFRLEIAVPLELQHGDRRVDTTTVDLSELGLRCRVSTRAAPRPEERVSVGLRLPAGHELPAELPARVARAAAISPTEVELGLSFETLEPGVRERLRRFVFETQLSRRHG